MALSLVELLDLRPHQSMLGFNCCVSHCIVASSPTELCAILSQVLQLHTKARPLKAYFQTDTELLDTNIASSEESYFIGVRKNKTGISVKIVQLS